MRNTKIEWCDHTVNFWWGCSEVSEACQNCYARGIAKRFKKDCWQKSDRLFRIAEAIKELSKLELSAKKRGVVETVFINSMSDFFDEYVAPEIRIVIWGILNAFKHLQFLILTKRAKVMNNHIVRHNDYIPKNVHFGITAENQQRLDERMAELLDFKGKLFLSCEPLLAKIDIAPYVNRIDWVICGGEKGGKKVARTFSVWDATRVYHECKKNKIPFFFKQLGSSWQMIDSEERDRPTLKVRQYPEWHSKA